MSFLAKLNIDEKEYVVVDCHYGMGQPIINNGSTVQKTVGGGILELELESTHDAELFRWMVSTNKKKDGNITFYRRDELARLKQLDFYNALCVTYDEDFEWKGEIPMKTKITISAEKIQIGGVDVINDWAIE